MKAVFHWCQKKRYLCDWSVAKADWLNHHHVELHLRLCGQDYLAGQNDLRIIIMMLRGLISTAYYEHLDEKRPLRHKVK